MRPNVDKQYMSTEDFTDVLEVLYFLYCEYFDSKNKFNAQYTYTSDIAVYI